MIALIVLFKLSARCNNHSIILIWIPVYSQTLQFNYCITVCDYKKASLILRTFSLLMVWCDGELSITLS